ncbi:MAG: S4 domain-containing protein [Bacteroidales bacterium]|jgi:ribosome-associated heat shock protein Hsp15|nr:S4 domain-containing protein [Bacteroidales bacterium]
MNSGEAIRIDKFLWCVRLFKTRSSASDACRKGRVLVEGIAVKPSRAVSAGEIIVIKKAPVTFKYRIIELLGNRVAAKAVAAFIEDLTPETEKMKLLIKPGEINAYREKGSGRPTKKERRLIDRIREDSGII